MEVNSYNIAKEPLNIDYISCCYTNTNMRLLGSETVSWNSFNSHNGKERKDNGQS